MDNSKRSSVLRSGELYLNSVEQAIMRENLNNKFSPSSCEIQSDGDLLCDDTEIKVEMSGEKPSEGTLTLEDGKVIKVEDMTLDNFLLGTDEKGNLKIKGTLDVRDKTAPQIRIDINSKTTNGAVLIVTATDEESEITSLKYSVDNEKYDKDVIDNKIELSNLKSGQTYRVNVKAINEVGLEATSYKEIEISGIGTIEITVNEQGWQKQKTVTITYPTIEGQELTYSYKKNSDDWTTTTNNPETVTFTENGSIIAKVTDGTNTVTAETMFVQQIDTTGPDLRVNINSKTTSGAKLVVTATDEESGISSIKYSVDNEDYDKDVIDNKIELSNLKSGQTYKVNVKATNGVGIDETTTTDVEVSEIGTIEITVNETGWQKQKTVTIKYPEVEGQELTYSYKKNSDEWKTTTTNPETVTFTENGSIIAKVTDGTNTITAETMFVQQIDTAAPTIAAIAVSCTETGTRIIVTAIDDESGIAEYSFDNGRNWQDENYKDVTEIGTYNIQVKDNIGNVSKTTQEVKSLYKEGTLNGAYPEIYDRLTPVRYNGTNWVVADPSEKWYNYAKQEWANAVILKSGVTKSAGETVNVETEVLAMFVWIPRYEYTIPTGTEGEVSDCDGFDCYMQPGAIDIKFIPKTKTSADSGYRIHPAFTFGDKQLSGIWVGKFETSHTELSSSTSENNLSCTDNNCTNADGLRILPNVQSVRFNNVSNFFYAGLSMTRSGNPFGLSRAITDSHMMKNSEWGAVAYLSQSKYGKYGNTNFNGAEKEVYVNNSDDFYTGRSGGSPYAYSEYNSNRTYLYNENINGTGASTTGNIYGVYDMSGGASEYVMGYYTPAYTTRPNSELPWGSSYDENYAGFKSEPDKKYYDEYTAEDETKACNGDVCYGHALSETKQWYGDMYSFDVSYYAWFLRGGDYEINELEIFNAGVFSSYGENGAGNLSSFRVVLSSTIGA